MKFRASKRKPAREVDPARQAELVAAAEALVEWVRERRTVWADDLSSAAPVSAAAVVHVPVQMPAYVPPTAELAAAFEEPSAPEPYVPPPPVVQQPAYIPQPVVPEPAYALPPVVPERAYPVAPEPPAHVAPEPVAYVEPAPIEYAPPEPLSPVEAQPATEAVQRPANAAAQWMYESPADVDEPFAIEQPVGGFETPLASPQVFTPAQSRFQFPSHLFARDGALVRWGVRGLAAAVVVAGVGYAISAIGPRLKSSVSQIQSSVSEIKSSVSDLKSSVSEIASKPAPPEQKGAAASTKAATPAAAAGRGRGAAPATVARTGRLTVESDPAGARVLVDGKMRGPTPLTLDDLKPGSYTVVIDSDKGSVRRTVKITAGGTTEVSENIFSGFVKVLAPYEISVSEGNRAIVLDDRGQALLSPGVHQLRFANRQLGYTETRSVEVEPGKTATVSLGAGSSKLAVTSSAPADVFVDGQRVGETPLADQAIPLGTHEIIVRGAAGERRFTTTVTSRPVRIDVDFSKP